MENRQISINSVLPLLSISSSGYYDYFNRKDRGPSDTEKRREEIKERIIDIHAKSHRIYGAPKITHELMKEGYKVSEKTVGNYMRQLGIKAHYIKPVTVTTTNSSLDDKLKTILNRDFNPESPNAYWCSDITYIWTEEDSFVYLTSVMDLFSRKIISWEVSKSLNARSVLSCIDKAVNRRRGTRPKIFHTDRGSQFVSYYYLTKLGPNVDTSYSRTANPWDNACMESFHALIKREWLDSYKIKNLEHARLLVFEYIDAFYNTVRIHSHCDYMSPDDYEAKYLEEMEEEIELQEVKLFTLESIVNTSLASPIS